MPCRLLRSLLLGAAMLPACTGDDTSSVSATTTSIDTTSASSTGTASDSSSSSSASSGVDTDTDTDTSSSSSGGPLDFPPVACGDNTCPEGRVCVQGGEDCDYSEMPPEWFTPPPVCADVPDPCSSVGEDEVEACLAEALCPTFDAESAQFVDGKLACPPVAMDCF